MLDFVLEKDRPHQIFLIGNMSRSPDTTRLAVRVWSTGSRPRESCCGGEQVHGKNIGNIQKYKIRVLPSASP